MVWLNRARRLSPSRYWLLAILLTTTFTLLSGYYPSFDPFFSIRQHLEDQRWRWERQEQPPPPVVLVDIDEASLERIGTWPWPRTTTATLVKNLLDDYQVSVVGLDLLFPDPAYHVRDDKSLAALARRGVVFANAFGLERGNTHTETGVLSNALPCPAGTTWPEARGYVGLTPRLGIATSGHLTPEFDQDGVIREYLPLIRYGNACYPALALAIYGQLAGSRLDRLKVRQETEWTHTAFSLQDPISGLNMPLTTRSTTPISWHGTSLPSISAKRVLEHTADHELLKHSVVLVGSTATGLGDLVATPLSPKFPGVLVHAEMLTSLIDHSWMSRPRWAWPCAIAATFILSFCLLWLGRTRQPIALTLAGLTGVLLWSGLNSIAWHRQIDLPWTPPLWVLGLQLPAQLLASSIQARLKEQRIYDQFSLYLPKAVLDALIDSGADPRQLEAERREITVLFADLQGFTRLSEPLPPEQVVKILHLVMTRLAAIIGTHKGTLDKFIGDEVMAFWGAPLPVANHADLALDCAEAMLKALPEINQQLAKEGLPLVRIGIGINSGYAAVGNMGSQQRRAYTALGDTVNLAARIEALTRELDEPVLLGEATCRHLSRHMLARLGYFRLRGRESAVLIAKPCFDLPLQEIVAAEPNTPVQGRLW